MTTPTPGTIPALTPYQPGALLLTGLELIEIASSGDAATAISGSMLLTDVVGKAPSVIPGAAPAATDVIAFFRGSTGRPGSSTLAALGPLVGAPGPTGPAGPPGAAGGVWVYETTNVTATNAANLLADTTAGSFTVTLPLIVAAGFSVFLADGFSSWSTNNLTVAGNGSNINGSATDLICDTSSPMIGLIYTNSTVGWKVFVLA